VLVLLVALELGLRIAGGTFTAFRDHDNARAAGGDHRVVVCLGESTTALGGRDSYPSQLEVILNERHGGSVRVINLGEGGRDTRAIIANLEQNLERFQPDVVVAMMGANDDPGSGALPGEFAEPTGKVGWLSSLRTVRLARLLWFRAARERDTAQASGQVPGHRPFPEGSPPPPPSVPPIPGTPGEIPPPGGPMPPPLDGGSPIDEVISGLNEAAHLLARGHSDQARTRFEDIIESALEDDETYLPICARMVAEPDPWPGWAVTETQRILAGEPDTRIALQIAGVAYRETGNLVEAEAAFRRALTLRPLGRWAVQDRNSPLLALLLLLDGQGREAEAEALLQRYRREVADDDRLMSYLGGHYTMTGRTDRGNALLRLAAQLRDEAPNPQSQAAYHELQARLRARGTPLVAVQYPGRELRGLVRLLDGTDDVILVDNEATFREAVARHGFDGVFTDACYGDFGHGTALGNRLLAENVADAIGRLWSASPAEGRTDP
jgi:tetratricopeptide (TPR) repeat protein